MARPCGRLIMYFQTKALAVQVDRSQFLNHSGTWARPYWFTQASLSLIFEPRVITGIEINPGSRRCDIHKAAPQLEVGSTRHPFVLACISYLTGDSPDWRPATQQVWPPALRSAQPGSTNGLQDPFWLA